MEGVLYYSCYFGSGDPPGLTAAVLPETGKVVWVNTEHAVHAGCTVSGKDGRLYLGGYNPVEWGEKPEDRINRAMESRKLLPNASNFAFTATPKNKTLEIFGKAMPLDEHGKVPHKPCHSYTMQQAIEEGFILDVLRHYTPVGSYYKLVKKVEDDPEFDTKRAKKKLRRYVESHDHAIRLKAEIMVDHFHDQVLAKQKIGGQARAMVVCASIDRGR